MNDQHATDRSIGHRPSSTRQRTIGARDDEAAPLPELPAFLTVSQAGEVLQLGRSTAYELTALWDRTGGGAGLPFVWLGHQKRVPRAALEALISEALHREAS